MIFVVKTDNDKHWLKQLHPFNDNTLTVDLNSWHAFTELEKIFGYAPKVLTSNTYPQIRLPMLNFDKNCG